MPLENTNRVRRRILPIAPLVARTPPRKSSSERRSRPDGLRRGIALVITVQGTETFASLTTRRPRGGTALRSLTRMLFIHLGTRSITKVVSLRSESSVLSGGHAGTVSKRSSPKSPTPSSNDDRLISQPRTVVPSNTSVPPRTSRSPLNSASPPISGNTWDRTRRPLLVQ